MFQKGRVEKYHAGVEFDARRIAIVINMSRSRSRPTSTCSKVHINEFKNGIKKAVTLSVQEIEPFKDMVHGHLNIYLKPLLTLLTYNAVIQHLLTRPDTCPTNFWLFVQSWFHLQYKCLKSQLVESSEFSFFGGSVEGWMDGLIIGRM